MSEGWLLGDGLRRATNATPMRGRTPFRESRFRCWLRARLNRWLRGKGTSWGI